MRRNRCKYVSALKGDAWFRCSPELGSIEFNINQLLMRKNLRVEAIWGSRYEHFVRGLPILEKNEFPYADMVSHTLPLSRVRDGFDALNGTYQLGDETVIKIAIRAEDE